MEGELSLILVFAAGFLSFLSPCVLPLIPSYLSILGAQKNTFKLRLFFTALSFSLGFTTVFVTLGILSSAAFFFIRGFLKYLNIAAGIIIIFLGFNVIFEFLSILNYEKRPLFEKNMKKKQQTSGKDNGIIFDGLFTPFFAGSAFAAGWTPCIGPILTSVLLMAGQSGKTVNAIFYLLVYSAGLALPFLAAALFFDFFIANKFKFNPVYPIIKNISGILLILIGILILTGKYSFLNVYIQKGVYSYIIWAQSKPVPFKIIADWLDWLGKF